MKGFGTHSLITQQLPLAGIERKGARERVGEAKRMGREENNYSMIYTSKPLERHGHHAEYCGGIDWCGEGQECYHNKRCWMSIQSRMNLVFAASFSSSAFSFHLLRKKELSIC